MKTRNPLIAAEPRRAHVAGADARPFAEGYAGAAERWLTYSNVPGTSPARLPTESVARRAAEGPALKWVFQAKSFEKFEATPIVVDGVMYTVRAPNDVVALDAATGRVFWTFNYTPSKASRPCCGRVNRGVAVAGSLDDCSWARFRSTHLIAIDAKSGKSVWNTLVGRAEAGYAITHAPLVIKDKVIVGVAGGEFGIRGYIAAYGTSTHREEAWKFYTVPAAGEPGSETWAGDSWKHGGGSIWMTGTYDPDLNLTYWGIGNPGPDWNGDKLQGRQPLYGIPSSRWIPTTGKLKVALSVLARTMSSIMIPCRCPVLADLELQGQPRKVMLWARSQRILIHRTGSHERGNSWWASHSRR